MSVELPAWASTLYAAKGASGLTEACAAGLLSPAVYECPSCGGDGLCGVPRSLTCRECNGNGVLGVWPDREVRWLPGCVKPRRSP